MTRIGNELERLQLKPVLKEQALTSLGWELVSTIDGTDCFTWMAVNKEIQEIGLQHKIMCEWSIFPILVKNQQLLKIDSVFRETACNMELKLHFLFNMRKVC